MVNNATEFVQRFLAHYASEYYDPVKAREYYLKTRELKGRRAASGLKTESQKAAWEYAKDKINTEKKELIKESGNEFRADIQIMRDEAKRRGEQLTGLLKTLLEKASDLRSRDSGIISKRSKDASEKISENVRQQNERIAKRVKKETEKLAELKARETERISAEASRKIAALPAIPKGISAEQRAELAAKRSEEIAKIRGTATKDKTALTDAVKSETDKIHKNADAERKKVAEDADKEKEALSKATSAKRENLAEWSKADKTKHRERIGSEKEAVRSELKATIETGRDLFKKGIERTKARYEEKLDKEYEAIKQNV